jgi:hypothetical protein
MHLSGAHLQQLLLLLLPGAAALPSPGVISSWAFRENATYTYSHTSSWVRVPSGALLAVFQATESHEGGPSQTKYLVRSLDHGATWSPPAVLVPWTGPFNTSGETLPWDGTLFMDGSWLRYVYATSPYKQQSAGDLYTISSVDEGATWSAPSLVFPRSVWGRSMSNINPPVTLPDGALALPVNTVPGVPRDGGPVTSGLVLVGADGEQWAPLGVVPFNLANLSTYLEPAVAACAAPNGNQLLMLLRTQVLQLWAARSTDAGATWTPAFQTPLQNPNSKVNLFSWKGPGAGGNAPADGDLVLFLNPFGNCSNPSKANYCPRTPLAITVSRDCGGSWGPLYVVEEAADGETSFGYPTAAQCEGAGGAPAICATYSLGTDGSKFGGIRFSVVPAANLV